MGGRLRAADRPGGLGGGARAESYRVRDATRLRDGRIVVGQAGTNEARIFREGGSFERSLGRTGDGPGEFRRLTSVTSFRGDSLIVFDYWTRRLAVFDDDGRLGRQLTLDAVTRTEQVYPLPDGRLVLHASSIEAMAGAQGRTRIPEPVLLLSADGLLVDTLAIAAGFETHVFAGGDALPPLGRDSYVALRDSVVIFGDATHMQYRVTDLEGRLGSTQCPLADDLGGQPANAVVISKDDERHGCECAAYPDRLHSDSLL